jgi:hypothetical protein
MFVFSGQSGAKTDNSIFRFHFHEQEWVESRGFKRKTFPGGEQCRIPGWWWMIFADDLQKRRAMANTRKSHENTIITKSRGNRGDWSSGSSSKVGNAAHFPSRPTEKITMRRAASGHLPTRSYLCRFRLANSALCRHCQQTEETVGHLLTECPKFEPKRRELQKKLGSL